MVDPARPRQNAIDLVLSHLPPGGTLVDVGANVGAYALQGARAVGPEGRVFCFEPRADTFRMLQRSVGENGFADRCTLLNKGLSDTAGHASMHHHALNPGASFVRIEQDEAEGAVPLVALDEIDFGPRVDFFKIDVEGFETRVLRGGREFFRRYKPPAISEVFPAILRENGDSSAEEYLSLWEEYGYRIRLCDGPSAGRVVRAAEMRNESAFPALFNIRCDPLPAS